LQNTGSIVGRNLRIALLISLAVHVIGMSIVTIVTPGDIKRKKPYTRVSFLGPILRKTAFDIMLESAQPILRTTYGFSTIGPESGYLKVAVPKRTTGVREFPERLEYGMDALVRNFLTGSKIVPDFTREFNSEEFFQDEWQSVSEAGEETERKVVYKPEPVEVMPELYGAGESFKIRVKFFLISLSKTSASRTL